MIGFVLAPGAEAYFYQAAQFQGAEAFMRPGVLIIGALIAASLIVPLYAATCKSAAQPRTLPNMRFKKRWRRFRWA
ncbi:hypothetical protein HORIV_39740 [Vreelandella olivaria]|uniref:Uncharacterized protein n=1 Tax=Vreelandella olivaria TaxID=390919 RepID=A0ABM7GLL0_9GAMM|nr:hypothetical protein HORIV_39740 [Halomonas olivaria]